MKALVTGGAGFIGSHIAEALTKMGVAVTVLDDLRNGDYGNLNWASSNKGVQFIKGDVRKRVTVEKVIAGCDWVFHEAALSSVPRSILDPSRTNQHNLDATLVLLAASRKASVRRFVYASSSAIYGDASGGVISETSSPNPLSPYALQKYSSERYCKLFFELYRVPTVSLRYFNVFGPRQHRDSSYSGVIARFCTAFLSGRSPTIFGDGQQTRDFVYIKDVVRANILAAQATEERVAGRSFNIGRGKCVSLLQLVSELQGLTGHKLKPHFEPERSGDVRFSRADISAATKAFRYAPAITFTEGLKRTLEFYRAHSSQERPKTST